MKTRKLGGTELSLITVGIGTWPMAGACGGGWGPQDDKDSIVSIRRGLEWGINWIDTAPNYGKRHSEEVVGKAIKGMSPRPIIATKCGIIWKPNGKPYMRLDRERVRIQCENSLKRLDLNSIDMYMIHWPRPQEYEVTSTITGPRAPSEIEDTIKAAEWELTKEDITAMDRLLKRRQESLSSK